VKVRLQLQLMASVFVGTVFHPYLGLSFRAFYYCELLWKMRWRSTAAAAWCFSVCGREMNSPPRKRVKIKLRKIRTYLRP